MAGDAGDKGGVGSARVAVGDVGAVGDARRGSEDEVGVALSARGRGGTVEAVDHAKDAGFGGSEVLTDGARKAECGGGAREAVGSHAGRSLAEVGLVEAGKGEAAHGGRVEVAIVEGSVAGDARSVDSAVVAVDSGAESALKDEIVRAVSHRTYVIAKAAGDH